MEEQAIAQQEVSNKDEEFKTYVGFREKHPDQPLFLPEGSVRAIIIITLTVLIAIMLLKGIVIPDWLISLYSAGVTFYFVDRKNVTSKNQ